MDRRRLAAPKRTSAQPDQVQSSCPFTLPKMVKPVNTPTVVRHAKTVIKARAPPGASDLGAAWRRRRGVSSGYSVHAAEVACHTG